MFGFFTYPHKVSKALFRLGWTPATLPSVSNEWLQVIHALRKSGMEAQDAAYLLDGALQGDRVSLGNVIRRTGGYGLLFFGSEEDWDTNQHNFLVKPMRRY